MGTSYVYRTPWNDSRVKVVLIRLHEAMARDCSMDVHWRLTIQENADAQSSRRHP
jgi:hypothetical protein